MSVGLLIITHKNVGKALLEAASAILGNCPLPVITLSIENDCDPEKKSAIVKKYIKKLDKDQGILILTDMYGSTPSNIACKHISKNIKAVSGLNLPMLVKIFNYPNLDLNQLINKATSGGIDGVMTCKNDH
ncbi:PTS system, mannose/fructose/sorbose family, IIA component [hydrothermal vent metagenome]|uniref:PTS system, mannose/fructose/sorbose family, IIA component n=1 Tax=hydrothermal vent metagenome TaxID=652676 RepID=A0A3B1AZ60_9ZZZZ